MEPEEEIPEIEMPVAEEVVEATWEDLEVEAEVVLVLAVEALETEEVLEMEVEDLVVGTQRNI